ncbi:hypothetical protein Pyn_01378 [Prunus yedoensis var. nudiflora]|uniref:Uncharacterized protein n=1 Tax=Prunus yedoensis var. nudiflora TaxID=2094558 RepID=A0A314UVH1_PRUYE|nr:hypothetical protein Pyn_01378 [Prunus yedoensis var. nudiflora]
MTADPLDPSFGSRWGRKRQRATYPKLFISEAARGVLLKAAGNGSMRRIETPLPVQNQTPTQPHQHHKLTHLAITSLRREMQI